MSEMEVIVLGMALGDGHIQEKNLKLLHCEKQRDYLAWKKKLLEKNGVLCSIIRAKDNNGFVAYSMNTKSYPFIKKLRESLYTPRKRIKREHLDLLTAREIAIWYMDDGGLSQKMRNGKVHANDLMINTGLGREENQIIIDYFREKWGLCFSQVKNHKCYRLRCGTKEARRFIEIVKPYVEQVPCMKYKIDIRK